MAQQITALPTPPSRTSPGTFSDRTDAFLGALPGFVSQANALATEAETNASTASAAASTAISKAADAVAAADAAAASSNATKWISGTTYAEGDVVWSPVDYQTYRRIVAGAGTTDPSADPTNWTRQLQIKTLNGQPLIGEGDVAVNPALDVAYADRGTLRSLTTLTDSVIVDGIGLFRHVTGSTEPDDDETCFATATGRWLLQCPHSDFITAQLVSVPYAIYTASAVSTIGTVGSVSVVSQTIAVAGASTADTVVVTPPGVMGGRLSVYGYVSAPGVVTVSVANPSAAISTAVPAGSWRIAVISTNTY